MAISRQQILAAMRAALEPVDHVNAMWLGGSAAFGVDDELSDIDVQLDVADGRHTDAFAITEAALETLSPIAHRWHVPEPAWHGHSQRIYRLRDCPEHLLVDLAIMQRGSDAPRFNEREIHGEPVVVFDKLGIISAVPVDRAAHRQAMKAHLERERAKLALVRHFPGKEIARGNEVDALWRYQRMILLSLITVLRSRYAPFFYDFAPRYLKRDLPPHVYARLMRLSFVADLADLEAKVAEAIAWATEEYESLDIDTLDF
ncbi:MAG: hypothetical protein MJE77_02350 [Proteobacteria bacterium]|nr:hypothetical protein [Pseudomonadota bacterium]